MDTTTENTEKTDNTETPVEAAAEAAPETTEAAAEAPAEAAPETTEAAAEAPTEAAAEAPVEKKDPTVIGNLTPEEQQLLMTMQRQKQQFFQKLGELTYGQLQIGGQIAKIEGAINETVNAVSNRMGVDPGTQWVATNNGEVRLVLPNPTGQNGQGGAEKPA